MWCVQSLHINQQSIVNPRLTFQPLQTYFKTEYQRYDAFIYIKKKDNLIYSFSDNNWFFQLPSLLIMVFELIFIFRSPQFKFNFWQDIALKLFIFKTNLIQSVQGTQKRAFRAIRRTKNTTVGSRRGSPSLLKDDSQGQGQRITFGLVDIRWGLTWSSLSPTVLIRFFLVWYCSDH